MSLELKTKNVILIVDDSPTNLHLIGECLEEVQFEVWLAQDGETALEKLQYGTPDLILLDIMMPGMDGFETCRWIKQNPTTKDIPVIFMSALAETVDKVRGLEAGAVDYITKPFHQEEVVARVQLHLKLRYLTQTIEKQNQELEQRVEERTAELSRALSDLKQAQIQLVQHEKLSSLGQLMAGVAHEINNPLSFILGNLTPISQYIDDLIEHLHTYQEEYPVPVERVSNHAEDIDLNYLLEDLPKLLKSLKLGTERIKNISVSLRIFSRADSAEKVPFNLHEGIDSTLLILRHRLKGDKHLPVIEVIKNYGDLPSVKCYPGQINQVFMNLIANAIDALEEEHKLQKEQNEKKAGKIPTIKITTETPREDWVRICIADNGAGMNDSVKSKLFEAFFTTKPAGLGTGLGLSISHQIVEQKHGGKLTFWSAPNQGSEFIIELPI